MSVKLENVPAAATKLRNTFLSGLTLPYEWRVKQLRALLAMVEENRDAIVGAVQLDLGKKHPFEAYCSEYSMVMAELKRTLKHLKGWMKPKSTYTPIALQPAKSYVSREPLGTVLIIAPWNYPVNLALVPLIGALAGGNTVFLKLSRHSAKTAEVLSALLMKYLDQDAIIIDGDGGAPMITALIQEKWDHVFFTGSVSVGRIVYEAAAKHLTPCTLELGGKNPVIIDSRVHMPTAARRIAWAKFLNSGQTCIAVDYALVMRNVVDDFIAEMGKTIKEFYGNNPQDSTSFARVISKQHTQRLAKLLQCGKIAIGGRVDENDKYVEPTVMVNVDMESELMKDEIFGPILPIIPIDSIEQAVNFIQDRPCPLAAYLYSDDAKVADYVQKSTRSGAFLVNESIAHFCNGNLPFGGVNESGLGKYHGDRTFHVFTNERAVMKNSTKWFLDLPLRYPPYDSDKWSDKMKLPLASRFLASEW